MCLPDLWKKLPEKLRRYTLTKENLGEPYLSSNHHINQNQSAYQLASISIHQHIEVVWKVALGRSFCQSYKLKLYFDFSPFQLFLLAQMHIRSPVNANSSFRAVDQIWKRNQSPVASGQNQSKENIHSILI